MKNKKILILLICVLIVILISIFFIVKKFNQNTTFDKNNQYSDYTPEEEISADQMKKTMITLYFVDSNNTLKNESKLIDSIELLNNPYQKLVELLLQGSKTENLTSPFPENTKLLSSKLENNCVILDFSEDFLKYLDDTQKYNMINSILNTLSQLNEVDSIKILINNNTSNELEEKYTLSHLNQ